MRRSETFTRRQVVNSLASIGVGVAAGPLASPLAAAAEVDNSTRMVAAIIFEPHIPTALRRALQYAGDDGFVASMPQLLHARTNAPYDNIIWNTWFTSNTEESVVTTSQGNHVVVAIHGGGIFASPERFERSFYADLSRYNSEGVTGQSAAKITEQEARDVLVGKLPDSTEIQYESWTPYLEIRSSPELRRQLYFQGAVERRLYDNNFTRSPFWAWLAIFNAEWLISRPVGVILEDNFERYEYDINTDAYFDYVENRVIGLLTYYASWYARFGIGPSWGILKSDRSPDDEYHEYGVVVRGEYNRGAKLWASCEYEPGRRTYPAFDPNATFDLESVFSDYTYHRLSVFFNWRIWSGVGLNLFLDYQPEDHEREGDDATATLFSISVSYVF